MVNSYYEKHKEKLQKEASKIFQNLSEEKKDKRQKKARERYQTFTEEEKNESILFRRRKRKNVSVLFRWT